MPVRKAGIVIVVVVLGVVNLHLKVMRVKLQARQVRDVKLHKEGLASVQPYETMRSGFTRIVSMT